MPIHYIISAMAPLVHIVLLAILPNVDAAHSINYGNEWQSQYHARCTMTLPMPMPIMPMTTAAAMEMS